ncbi:Fpg/Nei family DNA glycosylase [Embleya scabrispora]|uniref:Fpg/Nei family DNA glycosylase n=1 Tax=Embleya scabrispora TaxID=159449 RepID=UPI000371DB41|nr:DNA-formamidopyrimidine glycosylase family protein [Embleya scabrispora]MYS82472.1 Fpg/Nei family DNA glycosylase [Streptomyces sp. SID5474]
MPEGHTIHRLATTHQERFGGLPLRLTSPQGRFAESAALLDGERLVSTDAHGKHLFLEFSGERFIHVHLGLYGQFSFGEGDKLPDPVGQVRLRLAAKVPGGAAWADLRGPTACRLLDRAEKDAVHARLGPDPLRADADPAAAWSRIRRSAKPIGALLMEQDVLAGVGNVYRAEVLFRFGVDPRLPGNRLARATWDAMWADLVLLMREGVRLGRIDTVRPEHTPEAMGREPRKDDHGGEVYVYRRTDMPCLVCETQVETAELVGRNLFWCPTCQPSA